MTVIGIPNAITLYLFMSEKEIDIIFIKIHTLMFSPK